MPKKPSLGIFIPTIGSRPEYLPMAVESVKSALPEDREVVFFILVEDIFLSRIDELGLDCEIRSIDSEQLTIAEKVAYGVDILRGCDYVTWIGDDDLMGKCTLKKACESLEVYPQSSFVFGKCDYIDNEGRALATSKAGHMAVRILSWGPDLIPQPGTVWRQRHYAAIGGIDTSFDMAFDYDLFLRLEKMGGGLYNPLVFTSFRWHGDSSSVSRRWDSAIQASRVRRKNRSLAKNIILLPLEVLVTISTWFAGKLFSLKVS